MKHIFSFLTIAVGFVTVSLTVQSVSAEIIFVGPFVVGGAGFGNLPRALTVQSHGPSNSTESGGIAPTGSGGLISGNTACADTLKDVGGDEANPIGFPKQSAPTLSSLAINSGDQIGILFDAVQPQNSNNNVVTINDLTLKLYNGVSLVFAASGTFDNLLTNPGNGKTDYLFELSAAQAQAFNAALNGDFSDTIALDSTISFPNGSSGPESYTFINTSVPEPSSIAMLGSFFLLGLVLKGRKRTS
jgi:hypothetical protein